MQFRIIVGSYEHNLLCLSLDLSTVSTPVFQPIFHFQAHALSVRCLDTAKRYLVSGSNDEHIKIYDLQKRKELGDLLAHQGSITVLKFGTAKWLLSGSDDGLIIIWRVKDWEIFGRLKGHKGRVNDLEIHPSGKIAISCSDDRTVILWNLMTAKKASVLKLRGKDTLGALPNFVKWSLQGDHFIVAFNDKIFIYNTGSCKIVAIWKFKSTLMRLQIVKYENAEVLITAHNNGNIMFYSFDSLVSQGDVDPKSLDTEAEPVWNLQGHTNRIKDFKFFQDYFVSVSSDGKIVVWDSKAKDQVAVYDTGERLTCVTCCPEEVEKYVASKESKIIDEDLSEYETDNEEELKQLVKTQLEPSKNNRKNKKKAAKGGDKRISVDLE